jgi:hypothetical protein
MERLRDVVIVEWDFNSDFGGRGPEKQVAITSYNLARNFLASLAACLVASH